MRSRRSRPGQRLRRGPFGIPWAFVLLGVTALFLLLYLPRWYLDYLWFHSEGYGILFTKPLLYRILVFGAAFGLASLVFLFQLYWMFRRDFTEQEVFYPDELFNFRERFHATGLSVLRRFFSFAAVFVAFLLALEHSRRWLEYFLAIYASPFGYRDPLFGRDASVYVLLLPAFRSLLSFVGALLFFSLIGVSLYYLFTGVVRIFSRGQFEVLHPFSRNHLSLLLGAGFVWFGFRYVLARLALLHHTGPLLTGVARADAVVRLPILAILAFVCYILGIYFIFFPGRAFRPRIIVVSALTVVGVSFAGSVFASLYQYIFVSPNEISVEAPYLEQHIKATRFAYGLNDLLEIDYPVSPVMDQELESTARSALRNMRLWDHRPLLEVYQQVQTFRPYYTFYDVDIDRYRISGELQQVMLAARELDTSRLPTQAKTWVNLTFLYTHGYGVAMSPVHFSTPEGMPAFYLRDFPVANVAGDPGLTVTRPQIYFGEAQYGPVVVKSVYDEVDYPLGSSSQVHRFEATSGIPVGSLVRRAITAIALGDYRFLVSRGITKDSRLLYRRNIGERLQAFLPSVVWSEDPYIVISGGQLFWIVDGFVFASGFPYSRPLSGQGSPNYVRSPLKAVISAYSGKTRFYMVQDEPILRALMRIFPGVFIPPEATPHDLHVHWRYPEALFLIQASVLLRYHMTDPVAFYNQEDLWRIPEEVYYRDAQQIQPYYIVATLGSPEPEFVLMLPLSPARRDNLIGWFYAGNDGPSYGRLGLYKFPRDTLTYGPMQIEARIDQDPTISKDLTLWSQGGSSVIRGNLLVLPVGRTVLYVEPLFIQAEKGKIPELKRVFLASFDRVVMGEDLAEAIQKLAGRNTKDTSVRQKEIQPAGDLARIRDLIRQMDAALKRGDLSEFDRIFRLLKAEAGL